MIRAIIAAAALATASPALAEQPYGPADPASAAGTQADADRYRAQLAEADRTDADLKRIRRQADRWEYAYLGLAAADVATTCIGLARLASEGNPLYGRHPSCGKVAAIHVAGSALQYLLFRHLRERDPKRARLAAQIGAGLQGVVVGLNLRVVLK